MTLIPLGDIHIGAAGCDEALLRGAIYEIADTPECYWIGMGDYIDAVNVRDPRFDASTLAPWLRTEHLGDLVRAQRDRLLGLLEPIAGRCLAMLCGNHEAMVRKHYERDVYHEIVSGVKDRAGWGDDHPLALGYNGWLRILQGKPGATKGHVQTVTIYAHHGYTGGKLAGAKALDMQRALWTHACDLLLLGHSHAGPVQPETVYELDKVGRVREVLRKGANTGTFLRPFVENADSYPEVKGYLPMSPGYVRVMLRPGAERQRDRVRITI